MQRLKVYLTALVWQSGLGYVALWAITLWALDAGTAVFDASGVCRPDHAKVLFYWNCEPASPFALVASVANFALTVTVWAPVYVAAATVNPDAIAVALPIMLVHVAGLPAAIYVLIRLMALFLVMTRRTVGHVRATEIAAAGTAIGLSATAAALAPSATADGPKKPRNQFGLRDEERTVGDGRHKT